MSDQPHRFDLNLVRVFVTIYETGSVTLASERLGLTQPTISHSLARLRNQYGDRLFSRRARGLAPTTFAERLYEQLNVALAAMENTLDDPSGFDALSSKRRFRIALSDIGALFFTPPLLRRFQRVAPGIQVEFVQLSESIADALATGTVDLAVGSLPSLHTKTRNEFLFKERYVCLVSARHPTIGDSIELSDFLSARHVMVTSPASGHALLDSSLGQHGIRRNIVALVPQFSVLPSLVEDSELIVILPERVARLYASQRHLKVIELPVGIADFDVRMHWHARADNLPAHCWLRDEVLRTLKVL